MCFLLPIKLKYYPRREKQMSRVKMNRNSNIRAGNAQVFHIGTLSRQDRNDTVDPEPISPHEIVK